jgi:Zn-dependent protease
MSFVIAYTGGFVSTIAMMPVAFIVIAPAFVLHEMGHKLAAQHFHYWAEYRMWMQGLMMAVLLAVLTTHMGAKFVFIAPGAVYFSTRAGHIGARSMEKYGKIGLAGPLVNLVLASVFGFWAVTATSATGQYIGLWGAYVNGFLAMLNLLPIAPLDGQKIMAWNKGAWAVAITLALVILAMTMTLGV